MIKIEHVSFAYPNDTDGGLKDINLTIGSGECVLLCGRSGCGKTTITRLINGLIPSYFSGELHGIVDVDGMDVFQTPMYQIAACVGSVFQNPRTQFFNMDTDSEIAFGIENAALPPEELQQRVEKTADDLKICDLRDRNIFELSGGEKQKIAFASVYAMNPEVYLLDEPSLNLDMASIEALRKLLLLIKRKGKTILIAEHRIYYLMDLIDRVVYLSHGEIAKIYTPQAFRSIPEGIRKAMGLRTIDLEEIHPPKRSKISKPICLEFKDVTLRYK
ncbi:MAG: ABC transporter ATP-binding protein, partial [Oscillospiraceae bacterium]